MHDQKLHIQMDVDEEGSATLGGEFHWCRASGVAFVAVQEVQFVEEVQRPFGDFSMEKLRNIKRMRTSFMSSLDRVELFKFWLGQHLACSRLSLEGDRYLTLDLSVSLLTD